MAKAKAKKKASPVAADGAASEAAVAAVLAEVDKNYGQGIMRPAQDYIDNPRQVISVGPAFDLYLGGGIPSGSWVSVSGPEGCSKTSTMTSFLAQCQRPEFGRRPCMVLSAEHRMSVAILQGTRGLLRESPHLTVVESKKGIILSSADFLNIGLTFLKSVPGGVLLVDSISALVNPAVIDKGIGTSDFGGGHKLVTQFIDLAGPVVKANDCIVIGIVQFYANTSGYGAKFVEKAANKWKYQSDLSLVCKKTEPIFGDGDGEAATGQSQEWLVKKCAFAKPHGKITSTVRYGVGTDRTTELLELGQAFGLVSGSGWMTLDFLTGKGELLAGTPFEEKGEVKFQGRTNMVAGLEEYPAFLAALEEAVTSVIRPSGGEDAA
jgi:recombination protein RecA